MTMWETKPRTNARKSTSG